MNPSSMMKQSATIYPGTETQQSDGTLTHAAGTSVTSVCSVQPRSSSESVRFGRDAGEQFAVGYFPITAMASLTTNGIVTVSGKSWRVNGPPRDVGGKGVFVTVDLEAVA